MYEVGRLDIGDDTDLFPLPLTAENGDGGARELTFDVEPCLPLLSVSWLTGGSAASGEGEGLSGHELLWGCSFCNLFGPCWVGGAGGALVGMEGSVGTGGTSADGSGDGGCRIGMLAFWGIGGIFSLVDLESVSTKIFGRYAEMRCKRETDLDLFFGLELILRSSSANTSVIACASSCSLTSSGTNPPKFCSGIRAVGRRYKMLR